MTPSPPRRVGSERSSRPMEPNAGRPVIAVAISNLPIFHTYFCYLNYTPSIKVSQASVPVNGSQCFVLCNALYWIKIHVVFIEIQQIKV